MNDRKDPHEHSNDTAGTGDATGALYYHAKIPAELKSRLIPCQWTAGRMTRSPSRRTGK